MPLAATLEIDCGGAACTLHTKHEGSRTSNMARRMHQICLWAVMRPAMLRWHIVCRFMAGLGSGSSCVPIDASDQQQILLLTWLGTLPRQVAGQSGDVLAPVHEPIDRVAVCIQFNMAPHAAHQTRCRIAREMIIPEGS